MTGRIVNKVFVMMSMAFFVSFTHLPDARAQELPAKLQAAIVFKILNYDKNLSSKSGDRFIIGLLFDDSNIGQRSTMESGFDTIAGKSIQGKKIVIKVVKATGDEKIGSEVASSGAHAMFLVNGAKSGTEKSAISLAKSKKIPLFAANESSVKNGAAVGLVVESGKPKIIVNLPESKGQGMNLSANLLKLSKVIR